MSQVLEGKRTTVRDDGIVVFLIGARVNRWWLLPLALPVLLRMPAMLRELARDPELGLLGVQPLGLGGMVQYWRSLDHLLAYTDDARKEHKPAVRRFFKRVFRNQALGVWHETYIVPRGQYETLYINMPPHGLGRFSELAPATGHLGTSRQRLGIAPRTEAHAATP
jgi:hypothetical protein